ncbi:MAG: bacterial Ig-like domain-containing protein [Ruminococcus sp.]|nr:bacterial Ig-like domain-containing protein [Ruminococcus sp.]
MLKRKFRSIAALTSAVLFVNAGICTFTASADSSESYIITSDEGAGIFVNVEDTPNTIVDELLSNGEYTLIFPSDLDKSFENANIITPPSPSSDITVLRPNPDGYAILFNKAPTKSVYHIGEELDITGAQIYYCYDNNELADSIFYASLDSCLENGMMSLDTSEFDNTKAGTYTIYVHYGTAKASFEVTVLGDAAKLPNGDANGDGDFTIADMVIVQKHIMGKKTAILSDWKCADLYEDGKIDVYDFIVMRENFVKNIK